MTIAITTTIATRVVGDIHTVRNQGMPRADARCHRCGAGISTTDRIGRRDTCPKCGSDLHCCLNCRFYEPGYHNDCRETQAERQVDKEAGNFCECFAPRPGVPGKPSSPATSDAHSRLQDLFRKRGA